MPADLDLERADWMRATAALRRVARSVGASAAAAEDIAQGTLLAALRERASGGAPGRGWLMATARRRAIDWLRRGERRKSPESAETLAVQAAPSPAPPEIALQFEVQRSLMDAVEALPDPYREVIFLRYFEEVSVPEIAARKSVPVPTVRTWLTRAHGRLRESLQDAKEHRSPAWLAALAEFARGPSGALAPLPASPVPPPSASAPASVSTPAAMLATASFLMSLKTLTVAALALAILGWGWKIASAPELHGDSAVIAVAQAETASTHAQPQVETVEAGADRRAAATTVEAKAKKIVAAPSVVVDKPMTVRGIAFDAEGKPIPGMRIRIEPALPGLDVATTSAAGDFERVMTLPKGTASRLVPADDGLAVLFSQSITRDRVERKNSAFLVVAPARPILGTVMSTSGDAIQDARLQLSLPKDFASRLSEVIAWASVEGWTGQTAVDGAFELSGAPWLAGCTLTVTADGYRTQMVDDVPLDEALRSSGEFEITLEPQNPERLVRGVVLDPEGSPVPKARVGLGYLVVITGTDGRFEFDLEDGSGSAKGPQRLLATAKGWCPTDFTPDAGTNESIRWPDFVELRFQRPSLTIEGVVLGRDGEPKEGIAVWVDDLTVVGKTDEGDIELAENLGFAVSWLHKRYQSGADGSFQIKDLADRDYTALAMDLATLRMSKPTVISAGATSAVLQLDPAMESTDISGRVVDRAGEPIDGVSLEWTRFAQWVSRPGNSGSTVNIVRTEPVLSEPDGSFSFQDVPLDEGLTLHLYRKGYQPLDVVLNDLSPPYDDLSLQLGVRCDAKVFAESSTTYVRILNAQGEALTIFSFPEPNMSTRSTGISIKNGVSLPFQVSDEGVEIVFSGGGKEDSRKAIRLEPGRLNEIRQ